VLGQGEFDFGDRRKHFLTNFRYFKGNKIHFKAFGLILHNNLDKTYQAGHFHQIFFIRTYFKSPTSSPMRFWHFTSIKSIGPTCAQIMVIELLLNY
jgi:hypothetical protein